MNPLNLIQLNLQSPYEVWSESDDVYFFETDFDVKYKIYFVTMRLSGKQAHIPSILVTLIKRPRQVMKK